MKYRIIFSTILIMALSGCASHQSPQNMAVVNKSQASLAEASYSVSKSIVDLAETAQAAHPLPELAPPPNPASYGMAGLTTIDWSGPIEPLLKQLASASNYRLTVLGTPPAIPIIVTVSAKNMMLSDALRNAAFQCGRRAAVIVYPDSQTIELRYAKN